jgi:hypothetical protein
MIRLSQLWRNLFQFLCAPNILWLITQRVKLLAVVFLMVCAVQHSQAISVPFATKTKIDAKLLEDVENILLLDASMIPRFAQIKTLAQRFIATLLLGFAQKPTFHQLV